MFIISEKSLNIFLYSKIQDSKWVITLMCICRCVYKSKHNLLGWPKSSFQFFHKKLQENMNRFFFLANPIHKTRKNATINIDNELIRKLHFHYFLYSNFSTINKVNLELCFKFHFVHYSSTFDKLCKIYMCIYILLNGEKNSICSMYLFLR